MIPYGSAWFKGVITSYSYVTSGALAAPYVVKLSCKVAVDNIYMLSSVVVKTQKLTCEQNIM